MKILQFSTGGTSRFQDFLKVLPDGGFGLRFFGLETQPHSLSSSFRTVPIKLRQENMTHPHGHGNTLTHTHDSAAASSADEKSLFSDIHPLRNGLLLMLQLSVSFLIFQNYAAASMSMQ